MPSVLAHPLQRRFDFACRAPRDVAPAGWVRRGGSALGGDLQLELWAEEARAGVTAAQAVFDEIQRLERAWAPHAAGSELGRIQRDAVRRPVPLSEEAFGLFERALAFAAVTDGLGTMSDWRAVQLERRGRSLRLAREGLLLDLVGFVRGLAVDNAIGLLQRRGVRHACLRLDGLSRVLGDRRGRAWDLSIRAPLVAMGGVAGDPVLAHLAASPLALATHRGGVAGTAVVLAPDGLSAESLARTLARCTPDKGLALAARLPGAQVLILGADGQRHASVGLPSD